MFVFADKGSIASLQLGFFLLLLLLLYFVFVSVEPGASFLINDRVEVLLDFPWQFLKYTLE